MTEMTPRSPADSGADHYVTRHEGSTDESLSVAVADAIATFTNVDVIDLEPLHYVVDTDALDRLFEPREDARRVDGSVTFSYQGCLVTVSADGEIRVESAPGDQE